MVPAGTTKNGNTLNIIRCSRIPDVESVAAAANFDLQIKNMNNIELIVFADTAMPYVKM